MWWVGIREQSIQAGRGQESMLGNDGREQKDVEARLRRKEWAIDCTTCEGVVTHKSGGTNM